MDNATAEYAFITGFFAIDHSPTPASSFGTLVRSPSLLSPTSGEFDETRSNLGSEIGTSFRPRVSSISSVMSAALPEVSEKEEQAQLNAMWKQIMDPVLAYCQVSIFMLVAYLNAHMRFVDIHRWNFRSSSSGHPPPDNDPLDRRNHCRDPEKKLRTTGNLRVWYQTEDVAHIPKAHGGEY